MSSSIGDGCPLVFLILAAILLLMEAVNVNAYSIAREAQKGCTDDVLRAIVSGITTTDEKQAASDELERRRTAKAMEGIKITTFHGNGKTSTQVY